MRTLFKLFLILLNAAIVATTVWLLVWVLKGYYVSIEFAVWLNIAIGGVLFVEIAVALIVLSSSDKADVNSYKFKSPGRTAKRKTPKARKK